MTKDRGTEVTYRTTGDCSIELGSPKDGRMKLFFSEDEVETPEAAQRKIDNMGNILEYAKRRLLAGKRTPTPTN